MDPRAQRETFLIYQRQVCAGVRRGKTRLKKQPQENHIENSIYDDADIVLTCCRASFEELLPSTPPSWNGPFLVELSNVPLGAASETDEARHNYRLDLNILGHKHHILGIAVTPSGPCKSESKEMTTLPFIALFGGGSHTCVIPSSARRGSSLSKCFHQLMLGCWASHVKNWNWTPITPCE